jgi:hypothetical protein
MDIDPKQGCVVTEDEKRKGKRKDQEILGQGSGLQPWEVRGRAKLKPSQAESSSNRPLNSSLFGRRQVKSRSRDPPPHKTEHSLHSPGTQLGHGPSLQTSSSGGRRPAQAVEARGSPSVETQTAVRVRLPVIHRQKVRQQG